MRGFPVALLLGLILGSVFVALLPTYTQGNNRAIPEASRDVNVGGGTATFAAGFRAGERFLKPVEWPAHLVNPYAPAADEEQPGDGHDDELLALNRRYSDRSYSDEAWTGGLELRDVHGTPSSPICICDAVFIMFNETGHDPSRPIRIVDSSYILVDNLTVFGGGIVFDFSHDVTVTRTLMIDSGGIEGFFTNDGLVSDVQISRHGGPFEFMQHVNPVTDPLGIDPCWPEPSCPLSLIELVGADRWTIEWSYFYGSGGIGIASGTLDTVIRHNSFYGTGVDTSNGITEASWNLFRSWSKFGIDLASPSMGRVENNTMILYAEVSPGDGGFNHSPGVFAQHCQYCIIRNNDFLGQGYFTELEVQPVGATKPVLWNRGGYVVADDNFWGTIHDPRLPPDQWIRETNGAAGQAPATVLSRWYTQPIHDVPPLAPILNVGDYPYWVEQAGEVDLPIT